MKSARERSLDFWMISLSRSREREREREREKRWNWEPTSLTLITQLGKKGKKNRDENPKYQRRIRILPRRPDFPPFSLLKSAQNPPKKLLSCDLIS